MAYYRLYLRTRSAGRFSSFDEFDAAHDVAAHEHVATLKRKGSLELWCGDRLVARWDHTEIRSVETLTD